MPDEIVYCGVAEKSGVLVYHSTHPSVTNVVEALLGTIDFAVDYKKSYSAHPKTQGHTIQYVVDDEICFISAARDGFQTRLCFALLEKVKNEYFQNYQGQENLDALQGFLVEQMDFYSNSPDADKIRALQGKVDQVADVMHTNVVKLITRGDNLTSIESQAVNLSKRSDVLKTKAKEVRCAMCVQNVKMTVCLVITIVVVVLLLGGGIFGITQLAGLPPLGGGGTPSITGSGGNSGNGGGNTN